MRASNPDIRLESLNFCPQCGDFGKFTAQRDRPDGRPVLR